MKIREGFWFGLHPYLSANSFILLQYFCDFACKNTKYFRHKNTSAYYFLFLLFFCLKKIVPLQTVKQIINAA